MTVVAAVDRTDRAAVVVEEAARLGEAVEVVHVLSREEFVSLERTSVSGTGEAVPVDDVQKMAEQIAANAIAEANVQANAFGLMGDPAEEIVQYASEREANYIVVAGRKRSPVGKAVFGSVVQSVLLNAVCPVVSL